MQDWETIRLRCLRDKEPIKRVAREMGLAPNTIRKYLRSCNPPIKKTLHRTSVLDQFREAIDDYIRKTPKITAKRIHSLLLRDYDFSLTASESTMRKYVGRRRQELLSKEAFVRAEYAPGMQAQFDFSPMRACLAGKEQRLEVFVMRLSYSGHFFACASLREDLPALMSCIIKALIFFGGIPAVAIFDNAKTAVTKVLCGRDRIENETFLAFRGALAFEVQYAAPRRGNEKGGVEGTHGFIEDNFFRPVPSFDSLDQLNAALQQFSLQNLNRKHTTHRELIGERFEREKATLRLLPDTFPPTHVTTFAKINKFAEVTFKTNRYSVPTRYAFRDAFVELGEERLRIRVGSTIVADHQRAFVGRQSIINPMHCLDLIAKKHRSAINAVAFSQGRLPVSLVRLRDSLLARDGAGATKIWTKILLLAMNTSLDQLAQAVEEALGRGTMDIDAIKLLLHQSPDKPRPLPVIPSAASTAVHAQMISLDAYRIQHLKEQAS